MGLQKHSIETITFDGKGREYDLMGNPERLMVPKCFITEFRLFKYYHKITY